MLTLIKQIMIHNYLLFLISVYLLTILLQTGSSWSLSVEYLLVAFNCEINLLFILFAVHFDWIKIMKMWGIEIENKFISKIYIFFINIKAEIHVFLLVRINIFTFTHYLFYRYAHISESNPSGSIEIYLQGVDVIVFPDNFKFCWTLLLQYSKYDTVRDLFSRIANSIETEHFRLWKVDKSCKPVSSFISSISSQYENTNSVNIRGDIISNSDQNIMDLKLDTLVWKNWHLCKKMSPSKK